MQPYQGWGRLFKAVMHWIANPRRPVRLRYSPPYLKRQQALFFLKLEALQCFKRPGGEIGRHSRLKICRPLGRAGSIPASGTNQKGYR